MEDRIVFCLTFVAYAVLLMPLLGMLWTMLAHSDDKEFAINIKFSPTLFLAIAWVLSGWIF